MHKSTRPNRNYRVADQIQRDLAQAIARGVKDPRVHAAMVTLTRVELSADYAHAKVYFSLLQGDAQATTAGLNQAAGFLRSGLFKQLHIHTVPRLKFVHDATAAYAANMNALIAQALTPTVPVNNAVSAGVAPAFGPPQP